MQKRASLIQDDTNGRAIGFKDLGTTSDQQSLDLLPLDLEVWRGIGKDLFQGPSVFAIHRDMIPQKDTI